MLYNNNSSLILRNWSISGSKRIILLVFGFSFAYTLLEYYVIRDPSFGYEPILFSLIYPYHVVMATAIGLFSYWLSRSLGVVRMLGLAILLPIVMLFTAIITLEDFLWFVLRAIAPYQGDINAGKLITPGEWTTQFLGSTDAYFTSIPNWYFISLVLTVVYFVIDAYSKRLSSKAIEAKKSKMVGKQTF